MKRKYLRRLTAGLMAVALVVGGSTACFKQSKPEGAEHTVSAANGGTYTYDDGIAITVPPGSISQDARLVVTKPQQRPASDAPFGAANNHAFDISFERGRQPADGKPLELRIPLRGDLLPKGYKPSQALFYHRLPDGKGYQLMPAKLDGDVLVAKLPHLSEWQLVWLGDDDFKTLSGIDKLFHADRDGCKNEVEGKSAGKVRISHKDGWTNKSGPIKACLYVQDGEAYLSVVNRTLSRLSVATTDGVKVQAVSGGVSDDLVAELAKLVAHRNAKGSLGAGKDLRAKLTSANVPATVQLKAELGMFLAQAAYMALSLLTALYTGKNAGQVVDTIRLILDTQEVVDCLGNQMSIAKGEEPSFGQVLSLVASKCTRVIIEAIDDSGSWADNWRYAAAVIDLIKNGWSTFWSFYEGARMAFTGAVGVTVSPVAPECLSASDALRIQHAYDGSGRLELLGRVVCQNGLATARFVQSDAGGELVRVSFFRWSGGSWGVISSGSDSYTRCLSEEVKKLPSRLKVYLPC